jgi:predicted RNase H-like HicB family nuclease
MDNGPVAQWSELAAHNRLVGGSSPPGPTSLRSLRELRLGEPHEAGQKAAAPFCHKALGQTPRLCHISEQSQTRLQFVVSISEQMAFDPLKLSSPRIFLVRMLIFVVLVGVIVAVLRNQIEIAFMANPALNALIILVLLIGIALALRQVLRLYPEIAWVNGFRLGNSGLAVKRAPVLLAPMAAILRSRPERMAISAQMMRGILDSIATRLDEARDISRYMTGLLVFLGLLGTFWGLIQTVTSVGGVIQGLKATGDAASMFDALRGGLAAPLSGMGISFSSSLFGLAGSLVLGFLDLQSSQAQNRFYTELEDWLSTTVYDQAAGPAFGANLTSELNTAIDRLRNAVDQAGAGKTAAGAMANLAEAIQVLVQHMRSEQQAIREWVDGQAEQQQKIRHLLEIMLENKLIPPVNTSR